MDMEKIGRHIACVRKEKGYTQKELGDLLGVTDKTVSRWETGKYMPDMSLFVPLTETLGITLDELLSGESSSKVSDTEQVSRKVLEYSQTVVKKERKRVRRVSTVLIIAFMALIWGTLLTCSNVGHLRLFLKNEHLRLYELGCVFSSPFTYVFSALMIMTVSDDNNMLIINNGVFWSVAAFVFHVMSFYGTKIVDGIPTDDIIFPRSLIVAGIVSIITGIIIKKYIDTYRYRFVLITALAVFAIYDAFKLNLWFLHTDYSFYNKAILILVYILEIIIWVFVNNRNRKNAFFARV